MEIAPDTRMGLVELSVSDLDRSLAYWQDAIGLRVLAREDGTAEVGADAPLLRFVEEPGARPADGFTGLFHVALLVPDRASLGRFLAHTVRERIPLEGLSDHDVSERSTSATPTAMASRSTPTVPASSGRARSQNG